MSQRQLSAQSPSTLTMTAHDSSAPNSSSAVGAKPVFSDTQPHVPDVPSDVPSDSELVSDARNIFDLAHVPKPTSLSNSGPAKAIFRVVSMLKLIHFPE